MKLKDELLEAVTEFLKLKTRATIAGTERKFFVKVIEGRSLLVIYDETKDLNCGIKFFDSSNIGEDLKG